MARSRPGGSVGLSPRLTPARRPSDPARPTVVLTPRGGGPAGRKHASLTLLKPVMPELRPDEAGLATMHFEPLTPLPALPTAPATETFITAPPPSAAAPTPPKHPLPSDPLFSYLRGHGVDQFVSDVLSEKAVAAAAARPGASRFGYFRSESLDDVPPSELFNPFRLILLSKRGASEPTPPRYLTVSPIGGVTLWVDGMAREVYSLDEWRAAHASFSRVALKPVLRRFRRRTTFLNWLAFVQRARGVRRRAALLHARREPQDALEAVGAPAVTASALEPAVHLAHRLAGWIRCQRIEPQQIGGKGTPRPLHAPGETPAWEQSEAAEEEEAAPLGLGAANGAALGAAIEEHLRRATGAFAAAYLDLSETLNAPETQPLAQASAEGCSFVLEKYSPRNYPLIAAHHFNAPHNLTALPRGMRSASVGIQRVPIAGALRGASLETIERWLEESSPRVLRHTAAHVHHLHKVPAARLLRHIDMLLVAAVIQLPLDALRAFTAKFKATRGWRKVTTEEQAPVLTLRVERVEGEATASGGSAQPALRLSGADPAVMSLELLRSCVECLSDLPLPSQSPDLVPLLAVHQHEQGEPARRPKQVAKTLNLPRRGLSPASVLQEEEEGEGEGEGGDGPVEGDAALEAEAEQAWAAQVKEDAVSLPSSGTTTPAPPPLPTPPAGPDASRGSRPPRRYAPDVVPAPPPMTMRALLQKHFLDSPAPPVVAARRELESVMAKAIARAESAALTHPPFLATLSEEGQRAMAHSLRTLDVGVIRIDGTDLWPDEGRECILEPLLAPMNLSEQLTSHAHAPAPATPKNLSPSMRRPSVGLSTLATIASVLASVGLKPRAEAES